MIIRPLLERFSTRALLVLLLVAAWSAACTPETPTPTPTAQPTPEVITVHLASDLAPLKPVISSCAADAGDMGVLVFENPVPSLPQDTQSLTLLIGYPEEFSGRAYQLGQETYVLAGAAHSAAIEEETAKAIFAGEIPGTITSVWLPLEDTQGRKLLDAWMKNENYTADAFLSPGPVEMREILLTENDALGVLPAAWLEDGLQAFSALGTANVLALTQEKAAGKLRVFLGCLQDNAIYTAP